VKADLLRGRGGRGVVKGTEQKVEQLDPSDLGYFGQGALSKHKVK